MLRRFAASVRPQATALAAPHVLHRAIASVGFLAATPALLQNAKMPDMRSNPARKHAAGARQEVAKRQSGTASPKSSGSAAQSKPKSKSTSKSLAAVRNKSGGSRSRHNQWTAPKSAVSRSIAKKDNTKKNRAHDYAEQPVKARGKHARGDTNNVIDKRRSEIATGKRRELDRSIYESFKARAFGTDGKYAQKNNVTSKHRTSAGSPVNWNFHG
jgi:hypothetical protein